MLKDARARGIAVELLLGEPSGILPAGRAQLLQLLGALRHVPFNGLHLELEPCQLESAGGPGQRHLAALLDRAGPAATRVALSLEAAPSDAEALAPQPAAERERRIQAIEAELARHRFGGIVLQTDPDWLHEVAAATERGT